jgi:hypothetical protein
MCLISSYASRQITSITSRAGYYRTYRADYALRRTLSPDDAADILAETFLVAWRKLDQVPSGPDARLWLFGLPETHWPTTTGENAAAPPSPPGLLNAGTIRYEGYVRDGQQTLVLNQTPVSGPGVTG